MIRCLFVVAPGTSLPAGLLTAEATSRWRKTTVEWTPGATLPMALRDVELVVMAGWDGVELPHELSQSLAYACSRSMDVARFPVVVMNGAPLPEWTGARSHAAALDWCRASDNDPDLVPQLERLALGQRSRRRVSFWNTLLAFVALLLMTSVLGAGLLTFWAAGFDPALQEALVLLEGLEGPRPRLLEGESLTAWHDRLKGLENWQPVSLASHEMQTRIQSARVLLASWVAPLDLAALWPEVEETGTLERLRHLADAIRDFNPPIVGFADTPLGKDAFTHRDEILAGVRDADRQIAETYNRIEYRRELLALARHRTPSGVDWPGWYQAGEPYLRETLVVALDAPVRELTELRDARLAELESMADLRRARSMVNLLGLAGPGPPLLFPPAGPASMTMASERMELILKADSHALADCVAAGLPGAFVAGISPAVEATRTAWLAGGVKELLHRLKPESAGIEAWRTSLTNLTLHPTVSRWNQLLGMLKRFERPGDGGAPRTPLEELQRYFATTAKQILPTAGFLEMEDIPDGDMVLFLENSKSPESKVVLKPRSRERKMTGWTVAFRPTEHVPLSWAAGEPCTARLQVGDSVLAVWTVPATIAVGTEGVWGQASAGMKARLRWDPVSAVPEPPMWWALGVR